MVSVSPSLLAADFAALGQQCRTVLDAGARMLHFDVMDGQFVPNISVGVPVLASLHKALPDACFDVHLMIRRPLDYVSAFAKAGAGIITFHLEAESPADETIDAIHAAGCAAGLAIRPGTPVEALLPWLEKLELALVMSVEPGFGGQAFQPAALDKLSFLKKEATRLRQGSSPQPELGGPPRLRQGSSPQPELGGPPRLKQEAARRGPSRLWLEVDGGVDAQTAPSCVAAGANLLVAGTAVFGAADPAAAVRALAVL